MRNVRGGGAFSGLWGDVWLGSGWSSPWHEVSLGNSGVALTACLKSLTFSLRSGALITGSGSPSPWKTASLYDSAPTTVHCRDGTTEVWLEVTKFSLSLSFCLVSYWAFSCAHTGSLKFNQICSLSEFCWTSSSRTIPGCFKRSSIPEWWRTLGSWEPSAEMCLRSSPDRQTCLWALEDVVLILWSWFLHSFRCKTCILVNLTHVDSSQGVERFQRWSVEGPRRFSSCRSFMQPQAKLRQSSKGSETKMSCLYFSETMMLILHGSCPAEPHQVPPLTHHYQTDRCQKIQVSLWGFPGLDAVQ